MMRPSLHRLLLLTLLTGSPIYAEPAAAPAATTADAAGQPAGEPDAELQLAQAVRAQLKDGEALTLQAAGKEVLGIFTPQTRTKALGGLLLLPELNDNPDRPGLIRELRQRLPDAGWHTLAIQLPLATGAEPALARLDASRPRISAALAELERRAIRNIVIIGHGEGALAAVDYLANNLTPSVHALVVIGLDGREQGEPRLDAATTLGQIALPTLDIFGERDRAAVLQSAKRRYDLAHRNGAGHKQPRLTYADIAPDYTERKGLSLDYRQLSLSGADHDFSAQHDNLIKRLRGWLQRYAAGNEVKSPSTTERKP